MTSTQNRRIWLENFRQAFFTIGSHKFRSFLTVLGVLIGVITVVLVASILTGMRGKLVSMIEEFGTHNIYAFHLNTGIQVGRRSHKEWERKPLRLEYIPALKSRGDAVEDVAYSLFPRNLTSREIKYRGVEFNEGQLEGVSPNYAEVVNLTIGQGRFLSDVDNDHRLFSCVIGATVAQTLYPFINPVDKDIMVAGKRFQVVGVLEKSKSTFFGENENDRSVFIPTQTLQKISPREDWFFLVIRAKTGMLARAQDQTEQILRAERKLKANDESDFSLSTADSLITQFDSIVAGVGIFTIAISMVGLLVGGIGVMNIMLVSVRERTREIGVRKAIGARSRDINVQFLIEAMTLTGIGGVAGIVLAAILGFILTLIVPDLPAIIPLWAVVTAFTVSVLIGLVFGVWPATKASKMDPIECLRYE